MPRNQSSGRRAGSKRTIHDVARRAGVSITTVSRTINSSPLVDPSTARKVWKAIEELKYLPDTQARSLVSGRSRLLGLVVSDITNPFFPDLIQSFEDIAVADGYELLVGSTGYNAQRMSLCIRRMLERKVDGVAIMTSEMDDHLLEQLARRSMPMVFLDVAPAMSGVFNIAVDYAAGVEQAISHLVEQGHHRIAFIGGPQALRSANIRRTAFLESLAHRGLLDSNVPVLEGDHKMTGGEAALAALLKLHPRPTAVLASNDLTAIGVMIAARRAGLKIPQDLSIVGFDDIWVSEMAEPPLTTVRLDRRDIAHAAFRALRRGMNDDAGPVEDDLRVETHLVVRESTRAM